MFSLSTYNSLIYFRELYCFIMYNNYILSAEDNVVDQPRTRTPTVTATVTRKRKKKNSSSVEPSTSYTSSVTTMETQPVNTTDTEYSTEASSNDDIRGFEMHPLDRESSPPTVAPYLKGKLSAGRSAKSRKGECYKNIHSQLN